MWIDRDELRNWILREGAKRIANALVLIAIGVVIGAAMGECLR
jgi:hypothetical protein